MDFFKPKMRNNTIFVALLAVLTALTTVATTILVIPFPSTQGYFNLGDTLVMISGFLLGPVGGFIAGGTGSALADVLLGWGAFAPITFIAKGLEGMAVGFFSFRTARATRISGWDILGLILGSVAMLLGYLFGEMLLFGIAFEVAFLELITINSIQVVSGSIATVIAGPLLRFYLRDFIYEPESFDSASQMEFESQLSSENQ